MTENLQPVKEEGSQVFCGKERGISRSDAAEILPMRTDNRPENLAA